MIAEGFFGRLKATDNYKKYNALFSGIIRIYRNFLFSNFTIYVLESK